MKLMPRPLVVCAMTAIGLPSLDEGGMRAVPRAAWSCPSASLTVQPKACELVGKGLECHGLRDRSQNSGVYYSL